jgi:hypothetical protein
MDRAASPSVHVAHGGIPVDAIIELFARRNHPPNRGASRVPASSEDRGAGTALDAGQTAHGSRLENKGSFYGSQAKRRSNRREQGLPYRPIVSAFFTVH